MNGQRAHNFLLFLGHSTTNDAVDERVCARVDKIVGNSADVIQVRLEKGEVTPDALLLTGHISEAIGIRSCRIEEGAQYVGEDGLAYRHGGGLTSRPGYRDLLWQVADDESVGNGKPARLCKLSSEIVRTNSPRMPERRRTYLGGDS